MCLLSLCIHAMHACSVNKFAMLSYFCQIKCARNILNSPSIDTVNVQKPRACTNSRLFQTFCSTNGNFSPRINFLFPYAPAGVHQPPIGTRYLRWNNFLKRSLQLLEGSYLKAERRDMLWQKLKPLFFMMSFCTNSLVRFIESV